MKKTLLFLLFAGLLHAGGGTQYTWPCGTYPSRKAPYALGQLISYDVGTNPYNPASGYYDSDGATSDVPGEASCGVYHADLSNLLAPTYLSGNQGYSGNGESCPASVATFVWDGEYADRAYGTAEPGDSTRQPPYFTGYKASAEPTCDVIAKVWASCDYTGSDCPANQIGKGYCEFRYLSAIQQAWDLVDYQYPWAWDTSPSPYDECQFNPICNITVAVDAVNSKLTADLNCYDAWTPWYNPPSGGNPTGTGLKSYEAHMWTQANSSGQITTHHEAYLPAYGGTVGYANPDNGGSIYRWDYGWFYHTNADGTRSYLEGTCLQ